MIEVGWERRDPPLAPARAVVEARIARAFPGARVAGVTALSGGHCNTNLRVDLDSGRAVVLRLYQREPEACAREAAILRLLAGRAPVPAVLHEDARGEPPALVLELCPGRRLCDALPALGPAERAAIGRRIGEALASIHGARAFPASGLLGPDLAVREGLGELAPHLERMLAGRAGERLGSDATRALRRWIAARTALLEPGGAVLLHADFKPTNLLVRERDCEPGGRTRGASARGASEVDGWQVSAVLDWEFAFAGPRLFDVGQLLRHDVDELGPDLVLGFVAGYGEPGERWRERAAALDLLNLLGFLGDAEERPNTQGDARRLVLGTLGRWP